MASTRWRLPVRASARLVTSVRSRNTATAPTISPSSQMGIRLARTSWLPGICFRWTLYSGFPVVSRRGSWEAG